jgi:hypothetical protein
MWKRSTSEILILMMGSVVCLSVLVGALGVIAVEVFHPQYDTDAVIVLLNDVVRVMLGAVIGYSAAAGLDLHRSRRDRDEP